MTSPLATETVAVIVARHPAAARIFQAHRIDFCCHGDMTVAEALHGRSETAEEVLAEVEGAVRAPGGEAEQPAVELSTAALIARIIDRHHGYLRRALPALAPLLAKVAAVHGDKVPSLRTIQGEFEALRARLEPHLDEEEAELFPLLMARGADPERTATALEQMYQEHLEVGAALHHLRDLAGDWVPPEWACRSYRLAMAELEDLEADVTRHVHLENHVLRPRFAAAA